MSKVLKQQVGVVQSICQYPVKSMAGVKLDKSRITKGGIVGDRNYALIDQTNQKVASAKVPLKWAHLLDLTATYIEQPQENKLLPDIRITSSDGLDVLSSSLKVNDVLSEYVGRQVSLSTTRPDNVSLERLDPISEDNSVMDIGSLMLADKFSDYADIHLLTTASVEHLSMYSPDVHFDARRFRPNIVIDTNTEESGFVENNWLGKTLCIGSSVRIQLTDPTPRCAIPTLAIEGLEKDMDVLKTIVKHSKREVPFLDNAIKPCMGIYGFLVQDGVAAINDPVYIE